MGLTLTEYRNRLRVSEVLKDLQDGAENLRELAIRYGFADQAHMIRVVRRHHGAAPGTLQKPSQGPDRAWKYNAAMSPPGFPCPAGSSTRG